MKRYKGSTENARSRYPRRTVKQQAHRHRRSISTTRRQSAAVAKSTRRLLANRSRRRARDYFRRTNMDRETRSGASHPLFQKAFCSPKLFRFARSSRALFQKTVCNTQILTPTFCALIESSAVDSPLVSARRISRVRSRAEFSFSIETPPAVSVPGNVARFPPARRPWPILGRR